MGSNPVPCELYGISVRKLDGISMGALFDMYGICVQLVGPHE